jgi:hypothetical protein
MSTDLEAILKGMVEENRLGRDKSTADVSRLITVSVGGTDDEFDRVTRDLLGLDGASENGDDRLPEKEG